MAHPSIHRPFAVAALLAAVCLAPATATGQGTPPKKKPDPAVKEKMDELIDAYKKRKGEQDQKAVQIIDELLPTYGDMHEKDQDLFVKTLSNAFKAKRKPDQVSLYTAAAAALGHVGGKTAGKALQSAYEKRFDDRKDWSGLQDVLLEQVGMCREDKQVKFLLDEAARSPRDGVKAAAGRALRHFEQHPFKVRQEIVKEMVKAFDNVANQAARIGTQDQTTATARRTLRAISDPWNESLQALTGESIRTAPDWRSWWNDHKGKPKKWKHQTDD